MNHMNRMNHMNHMNSLLSRFSVLILLCLAFAACSKDEAAQPAEFTATQSIFDGAHVLVAREKTGPHLEKNANGGYDTIPLNGYSWKGTFNGSPDPDGSFRTVMANFNQTPNVPVGSILVKRVYKKTDKGKRGELVNMGAMIKHPAGYFPEGGDFEYMLIDPSSITDEHPNGQLNAATFRGKKSECGDCHFRAGKDYVFLN